MVDLTKALRPDDIEQYIVRALADGSPLGQFHEAWYITRAGDSLPALILFRHITIELDHVYRLCALMLQSGISHGYLVTTAPLTSKIVHAARSIGITLLDETIVEGMLTKALED